MTNRVLGAIALAAGLSWFAAPAHAVLTLTITDLDTGDFASCSDNAACAGTFTGAGGDLSAATGHILFNGTVGQFFLGTESVLSNATTASQQKLHTDNVHVTDFQSATGGAGQVQIVSEETYTAPIGPVSIRDDFSLSTNVFAGNGSIDYLAEIDLLDGNGFQTIHSNTAVTDLDDEIISTGAFTTTGPYVLRHTYLITAPASSSGSGIDQEASSTHTTTVVPEPATLGLLGAGLLGLGLARRRRKA